MIELGNRLSVAMIVLGGILFAGCQREEKDGQSSNSPSPAAQAPSTQPSPATAPAVAMVDYADKGCHFKYANIWKPIKDKDYELHLIPAQGPADRNITFDIPDLPPHFPGMITLNRMQSGYVDDLKKKHADLHVDSSNEQPVPNSKARL